MAHIRKRGESWYAEVSVRGVKVNATRPTKGEAKAWADATERRIREGKGLASKHTLLNALDKYSESVSTKKKSVKWEQNRLRWLSEQPLAKLRLDLIDPATLADWRDERLAAGISGETVIRDFTLLSHVFTVARREWKWVAENPCSDVARPPAGEGRKRRVANEELALLYAVSGTDPATIQGRTILCFEFCIETACRGGEAVRITPKHRHGDTVHLPMTKNGDARDVPLSPRAVELLGMVNGAFKLTDSQKDANFRRIRDTACLPDLHFHDSRHEATCRLAKVFDVLDLARVTGHRNVNELLTYYHADAHDLASKLRLGKTLPTP